VLLQQPTTQTPDLAIVTMALAAGYHKRRRMRQTPFEQWVTRFPLHRAAVMRRDWLVNCRRPKTKFKTFTKRELANQVTDGRWPDVTARAIQNPDAATTVYYGRWYHCAGNLLKSDWHAENPIHYTAGRNAKQLGEWFEAALEFVGPSAVITEGDSARWDGRYGLRCAGTFALHCHHYGMPRRVIEFEFAVFSKFVSPGLLHVICLFFRLSGVPGTSVGNSAADGYCILRALVACGNDLQRPRFRSAVLGDDNITVHPPDALTPAALIAAFDAAGHRLTAVQTTKPLHATYCSGRFYHTTGGRVWAPKAGRALAKMGWHLRSQLTDHQWLYCASVSWYFDVAHVPVLRAVAAALDRWSRELGPPRDGPWRRWWPNAARPRAPKRYECSQLGMSEFCELYGLAPSDVEQVEAAIALLPLGSVFDHWVVRRVCAHDVEDRGPATQAALSVGPYCGRQDPTITTRRIHVDELRNHDASFAELHDPASPLCPWPTGRTPAERLTDFVKDTLTTICSMSLCGAAAPHDPIVKNTQAKVHMDVVVIEKKGPKPKSPASGGGRPRKPPARPRVKPPANSDKRVVERVNVPMEPSLHDSLSKLHAILGPKLVAHARQHRMNPEAVAYLLAYTLPLTSMPVRHTGQYDSRPTGIARPWTYIEARFYGLAADQNWPSQFDLSSQVFCLFKDPRRYLTYIDFSASRAKASVETAYQWYQEFASGGPAINFNVRGGDLILPSYALCVTTRKAHGPVQRPILLPDGSTGFEIDACLNAVYTNSSYSMSGGFVAANTYLFTFRVWHRGGYSDIPITRAGAAPAVNQAALGMTAGAHYAVSIRYLGMFITASGSAAALDTTPIQINVKHSMFGDCIGQLMAPGFDVNEPALEEIRYLTNAMMFTNDASPGWRAGKVAQYQSPGSLPPDLYALPPDLKTPYEFIADNPNAWYDSVEEGAYGWARPSGGKDYDMLPLDGPLANAGVGYSAYPMVNTTDYIVMTLSIPIPTEAASPQAQSGRLIYGGGVEFESEDTWRYTQVPPGSWRTYADSVATLKTIPQFSRNKNHFASVLGAIRSIGRVASRVALAGAPVATALGRPDIATGMATGGALGKAFLG